LGDGKETVKTSQREIEMTYRNDLAATHERIAALEAELKDKVPEKTLKKDKLRKKPWLASFIEWLDVW
jgi:hypothetical protein